jgi:hypothetical protein
VAVKKKRGDQSLWNQHGFKDLIAVILAAIGDRFRIVPITAIGSALFLVGLVVSSV